MKYSSKIAVAPSRSSNATPSEAAIDDVAVRLDSDVVASEKQIKQRDADYAEKIWGRAKIFNKGWIRLKIVSERHVQCATLCTTPGYRERDCTPD